MRTENTEMIGNANANEMQMERKGNANETQKERKRNAKYVPS